MARTSRKNHVPDQIIPEISDTEIFRTAIYLRLSLEDNGKKDGDSMENQQKMLLDYVVSRPYLMLVDTYMDNGYTGTDFSRPEFSRMMDDVKAGKINCIVVKDLSRLGRNYVEAGDYLEKVFPFLNVRFIAVNDHYDSAFLTSGDQLGASLKNIVNDMYAKDISRKITSAMKAKRLRGDYIGNYAPYGYLKDPENPSHLIIDQEIAPIVVEIFEMRATGAGIATIARALNEKGYPSPGRLRFERGIITNNNKKGTDLPWNRHVLTELLRNVVYIGNLAQGRSTQCLYKGIAYHWTDPSEWDVVEHTHEPIISMELWERAQSVDKRNSKAAKDSFGKYAHLPKRENPYGSLLRCADCGRVIKYVRSYSPKGDKAYYNYKCPENIELGDSACPKKNIRAQDLDTVVLATLQKQMELYLDTQKVLHRLIVLEREKKKRTLPAGRIEDIRREIEKRKNLSTAIYTDYKEGLLTQDEYLYAKKKYHDELRVLEQELSELRGMDSKAASVSFREKHWQDLIDRYYGATELTGDMVRAMVREIRLHANSSVSVEFLYMNEFEALIRECERLKKEVA